MTYAVVLTDVPARPTLVVPATTTWPAFPTLCTALLDDVWACLRVGGITGGRRNVMLYIDDTPRVEVGVESGQDCPLTGRVVASSLPAGRAAMATHHGSYAGLADAHRAVVEWAGAAGYRLAGPRWEVYGHWREGAVPEVEVFYLVR